MTEAIRIDDLHQLESLPYVKILIIINEFITHLFKKFDLEKKYPQMKYLRLKK